MADSSENNSDLSTEHGNDSDCSSDLSFNSSFFAEEDGVVRPYQFEPTTSVSSAVQGLGALEQNNENSDNNEWRLTDNSWYVLLHSNLVII